MNSPVFLATVFAVLWLVAAIRYTRQAVWVLLLWIPIQGWFQLNVFNDSTATVLLYEFQIVGIQLIFLARALRSPNEWGPPRVVWLALPFVAWTLLLVPFSLSQNGFLLTVLGLRTYLLPLPLVWIGYRSFTNRKGLETVTAILMLQTALSAAVAAMQLNSQSSLSGTVFDVPLGYSLAGVIRPPGDFFLVRTLRHVSPFRAAVCHRSPGDESQPLETCCVSRGIAGRTVGLMVNTQRAAIVILAVILPLIAVMARRRQAVLKLGWAVAIILVGGTIGLRVAGPVFEERINSIALDLNNTLVVIPLERLSGALETPVFGGGLGIASPGSGRLAPTSGMGTAPRPLDSIKPSESFTAALVYQSGIPGMLLLYGFIAALFIHSVRAMQRCKGTDLHLFAACIVGFELAIVLQSWAYDPLHFPPSRVFFWFWAGALLNLPRLAAQSVTDSTPVAEAVAGSGTPRPTSIRRDAAFRASTSTGRGRTTALTSPTAGKQAQPDVRVNIFPPIAEDHPFDSVSLYARNLLPALHRHRRRRDRDPVFTPLPAMAPCRASTDPSIDTSFTLSTQRAGRGRSTTSSITPTGISRLRSTLVEPSSRATR